MDAQRPIALSTGTGNPSDTRGQMPTGKLKKHDRKSNMDLNFHKMFAGFQLV